MGETLTQQKQRRSSRLLPYLSVILVTIGVACASWTIIDFGVSNISGDRRARELSERLEEDWKRPLDITDKHDIQDKSGNDLPLESSSLSINDNFNVIAPTPGDAFARLYVPHLRDDVWGIPIIEGVKQVQLNQGVGHYPDSALPGKDGNFSLFGHRTGSGQPFTHVERLVQGDEVIVETREHWFVYTLRLDKIVPQEAIGVTSNAPLLALEVSPSNRYRVITLITCEPRWSTDKRWVWWGVLAAVYPADTPPLAIQTPLVSMD